MRDVPEVEQTPVPPVAEFVTRADTDALQAARWAFVHFLQVLPLPMLTRLIRPLAAALVVLAAAVPAARAQHPSDAVFVDTLVARVYVEVDTDSLARLYADPTSDHEVPARFTFERGTIRETVASIGFRLRGNTSRASEKKSFKVSFNTFVRGQAWRGLEKLNLNGEHNDPSVSRSAAAWRLYRRIGIAAPRLGYAALYINGAYAGLYANVEHIDETFLGRRFGREDGDLFKCLYPASLVDLGSTGAEYRTAGTGGRQTYELTQGGDADAAYDRLARLVTTLNRTPIASLPAALEPLLDVNTALRMLAADVAAGQWDGYWGNQNNYYLHYDLAEGRFAFLPYDADNTLGIDFLGQDWGRKNPYTFGSSSGRPLATRLLAIPEYRARYTFYLRRIAETSLRRESLAPLAATLDRALAPWVATDPQYPKDYGYTLATFHASFEAAAGNHVKYGLLPFADTRRTTLLAALDATNVPPIVGRPAVTSARLSASAPFVVAVRVEDEAAPAYVSAAVSGAGAVQERLMKDDGLMGDAVAGDGVFSARFAPTGTAGRIRILATAQDAAGQTRSGTIAEVAVEAAQAPGVVVNEFLASNGGSARDPFGDADDYVELYNPTGAPVRLAGYTLTDNAARPDKWALPDTTLAPGAYLVVWADEEGSEGPAHANFKLSAGGEHIGLYNGLAPVDTLTFGQQTTDVAMGRVPNGTGPFVRLAAASPGAANVGLATSTAAPDAASALAVTLGPNPVTGPTATLRFAAALTADATVEVFDVLGRRVSRQNIGAGATSAAVEVPAASGVYIVRITSGGAAAQATLVRM